MNYKLIAQRRAPSAIEQVLINRGIAQEEVMHYLYTTDADILDPSGLNNLEEGAKLLASHIANNAKIMVQVDSDCDGYTSAAALINYLNHVFPAFAQNNISYRPHTEKQHGIILETIPDDIKLVIAPDSSSNDYEVHEALKQRGVDVLVLDHHEADYESKFACVINNQLSDNYKNKSLSGVGIVYKFCCYLDKLLNVNYADEILDLVALGIVADMMDLRDFETRHLVTLGLIKIQNPYFKGMVEKQAYSLGGQPTPIGIAFYIAPFINAVTRSGTIEEKLNLFEAMLDFKAYEEVPSTKRGCKGQYESRVEQACRNCTNIKNRQTKTRDASLEIIEQIIEEQNLNQNKILLVCIDKDHAIDKNLVGLVANQIANKYHKPTLVLNEYEDCYEGSGRGYDKSAFKDFRTFLEESGLVNYAQGHANAMGCSISKDRVDELNAYANKQLKDFDFTPKYDVDFIYDANDIDCFDILNIADYKRLWGQGMEEPYIAIENIKVTKENIQLLKGTTIKITLGSSDCSLIKFRSTEEEYNALYSPSGCVTINVIGRCERNSWDDKPQIFIEDYSIENRQEYYF